MPSLAGWIREDDAELLAALSPEVFQMWTVPLLLEQMSSLLELMRPNEAKLNEWGKSGWVGCRHDASS